ncbi:MAG: trigger factor [Elusimicrobia bacterium RIFOXYA2_FULL_50_26]|nr:MAG: trigger factor [Elusimicrobia bacterium RIFOXYA2_FULL_50_26]OGS23375.1 MAG: trigger factor [Elusimicrobia bacterium RIFOXYB2_FULL_50_12]
MQIEKTKIDVVDEKECAIVFAVEVPAEEVRLETENVFNEIQKTAQLPGFRVGKAPREMVRTNYKVMARERVIENLINRSVSIALSSKSITPVTYPRVDNVSFDFEKPFSYRLHAEKHPEFKVKDYKGIPVKKEIMPVTDEKVKEKLNGLRERNARLVESGAETVGASHFVLVDYEAFSEGQSVEELKTSGQMIDMSAAQGFAGFNEGLMGAKKNEEREIKVRLPREYPDSKLAEKEVVFKVKVKEIKEKSLPALDDEFARDIGIGSIAELESSFKSSMEDEEKRRQSAEVEKQIIEELLKRNEFAVPESLIEEQYNHLMARMAEYFRRQHVHESVWQKNSEQMKEKYRKQAESDVRISYILNAVASEQKIDATDEDMKAERENMYKTNPSREGEIDKYFGENKERIQSQLREKKIFDFLISEAKIKEEIKK